METIREGTIEGPSPSTSADNSTSLAATRVNYQDRSILASRSTAYSDAEVQKRNKELERLILSLTTAGDIPGAVTPVSSFPQQAEGYEPLDAKAREKPSGVAAKSTSPQSQNNPRKNDDLKRQSARINQQRNEVYIDMVKEKVADIANGIKKDYSQLALRVAFALYRDYGDRAQDDADTCNFTSSFEDRESVFVRAVTRVQTGGRFVHRIPFPFSLILQLTFLWSRQKVLHFK